MLAPVMYGHTPFIDAAAVEAWDAWFRWRERDRLHDLSIEATWQRVADGLSERNGTDERDELFAALASWRLLLDERILSSIGTAAPGWPGNRLVAVLNLPMFIRHRFTDQARLDREALEATAVVAVRALDDAMGLAGGPARESPQLRIGLIGVADALLMLGLRYCTQAARLEVAGVARVLAQGCLRGSVRLAAERGRLPGVLQQVVRRARVRGLDAALIEDASVHGVRHAGLTAITSQPRLALFANNVADALEPLRGEDQLKLVDPQRPGRAIRSSGYALTLLRRTPSFRAAVAPIDTMSTTPVGAHLAMCHAVQRWIDEAVATPPSVLARVGAD
jgi:ribonucleoside-diphosphate reductase alpha chain